MLEPLHGTNTLNEELQVEKKENGWEQGEKREENRINRNRRRRRSNRGSDSFRYKRIDVNMINIASMNIILPLLCINSYYKLKGGTSENNSVAAMKSADMKKGADTQTLSAKIAEI